MICECCKQVIQIPKRLNKIETENYIYLIIMEEVCKYYGFSQRTIEGKSRMKNIIEARYIFIDLLYNDPHSKISKTKIGHLLNRDHSTIIHSLRNVRDWIKVDEMFRTRYQEIHTILYGETDILNKKLTDYENDKQNIRTDNRQKKESNNQRIQRRNFNLEYNH